MGKPRTPEQIRQEQKEHEAISEKSPAEQAAYRVKYAKRLAADKKWDADKAAGMAPAKTPDQLRKEAAEKAARVEKDKVDKAAADALRAKSTTFAERSSTTTKEAADKAAAVKKQAEEDAEKARLARRTTTFVDKYTK